MKKLVITFALFMTACGLSAKSVADFAVDEVQASCLVAHADLDDATVNKVCHVAEDIAPNVRKWIDQLLGSTRAKMAAVRAAGACKPSP